VTLENCVNTIWNYENTTVVATGLTSRGDVGIEGYVRTPCGEVYSWAAWAKPQGWYVESREHFNGAPWSGVRCYQGATFNLGLEVAAMVKHTS